MHKYAFFIGNLGLGDIISMIGMVNYLSTLHEKLFVICRDDILDQVKYFYNDPKIILYPINEGKELNLYELYDVLKRFPTLYDVYAVGNYGADYIDNIKYIKIFNNPLIRKPVIHDYPTSYYEDCNVPITYISEYFTKIQYPQNILDSYDELLKNYPNYIVIHSVGSNLTLNHILECYNLDKNNTLIIDVNHNIYLMGHKYYEIAQKFVNLSSIIFYAKLLENASALYLIDSCIHALALVVNIDKANPKICFRRESRFKYAFDKFHYEQIIIDGNTGMPYIVPNK